MSIITNEDIRYLQDILDPHIHVQELIDVIIEYVGVLCPEINNRKTRIVKNKYYILDTSAYDAIHETISEFKYYKYYYIENIEGIPSSFDEKIIQFTSIVLHGVVLYIHNGAIRPRFDKKYNIDLEKQVYGETSLGNYIDIIGSYSLLKRVLL